MAVLINFKICDNAKECGGIEVCPTRALFWDEEKKTVAIDNSKCTTCGKCEDSCPVGAIRIARTPEEYEKIKKEIDEDPRKISDLLVDRYGAQLVHPAVLIQEGRFDLEVLQSHKLTAVEFFNDDSIMCLLYAIPLKELFEGTDIKYKKQEVKDDSLLKEYGVKELPSMLFFKDGKMVGKIEGYYDHKRKKELLEKINEIVSLNK